MAEQLNVGVPLDELREFKKNFKLSVDYPRKKAGSKGHSLELDQEKEKLVVFYNNFHLHLDKSQSEEPAIKSPIAQRNNSSESCSTRDVTSGQEQPRMKNKPVKRKRLPPPKSADFSDLYEMTGDVLGKGENSSVTTCLHKISRREFAVKIVKKSSSLQREKVLKEVEILYMCKDNRTVLQLVEFFENSQFFYLVFDKMFGGPLLAHIQKQKQFTEREASDVVREVAEALDFLHKRGVAHRDLKPANILCERVDQVVPVRICDFDLSSTLISINSSNNTPISTPILYTPVGSAEFMAPEVVRTFLGEGFSYDKKCDLWSLGVMLYMILCGQPPFRGVCGQACGWEKGENCRHCQDMLLSRIKNCEYSFSAEYWKDITDDAKNLIRALLQTNSKLRPSAAEVLDHKWLRQKAPDTPLHTPEVLKRFPGTPNHLSDFVAACIACERQLTSHENQAEKHTHRPVTGHMHLPATHPYHLSSPGTSELALRREFNSSA